MLCLGNINLYYPFSLSYSEYLNILSQITEHQKSAGLEVVEAFQQPSMQRPYFLIWQRWEM
jgi:hypothetical protein